MSWPFECVAAGVVRLSCDTGALKLFRSAQEHMICESSNNPQTLRLQKSSSLATASAGTRQGDLELDTPALFIFAPFRARDPGIAERRAVKLSTKSRRRDLATRDRRNSSSRPKLNPPTTVLLASEKRACFGPVFGISFFATSTPSARRSLSDDTAAGGADAAGQSRAHDTSIARKENGSSSTTTSTSVSSTSRPVKRTDASAQVLTTSTTVTDDEHGS
ncbi:hypothetical protein EXIGLDRAFT_760108 [Exidia glandulosa HHB12029]|uniref:Uncharacterized protein n=1 Tax=Exidia glandulosa HHB12029 TaxID=1314781 RepID=A0A165PJR5_EXIGL|nr:hypothetical protein EXIGLDRAFT_760108 [Exidia glandulosa HHB12029]